MNYEIEKGIGVKLNHNKTVQHSKISVFLYTRNTYIFIPKGIQMLQIACLCLFACGVSYTHFFLEKSF